MMNSCPICGEELRPGAVCSCGWDRSRDCEQFLSLVPAESGRRSAAALRKSYVRRELDAQRQAYETRIAALESWKAEASGEIAELKKQVAALAASAAEHPKKAERTADTETKTADAEHAERVKVESSKLFFGQYPQGAKGEIKPIEWIVLKTERQRALLVSRYGLDEKPYHSEVKVVTWEACSLRSWLNSYFFYEAFTAEEQAAILTEKVTADANPKYETSPGGLTYDRIFLLSTAEAEKYFHSDEEKACRPTDYAEAKGAYVSGGTRRCWWWLRSPGYLGTFAAAVDSDGTIDYRGNSCVNSFDCVRPAMWIRLKY